MKIVRLNFRHYITGLILALLSWEIHCIIWWIITNGFSFQGKVINHFGELSQGNLLEWMMMSLVLGIWYAHQIVLYFVLWLIIIWGSMMIHRAVSLRFKTREKKL